MKFESIPGFFTNAIFKIASFFMPILLLVQGTSVADLDYSDMLENEDYTGLYEVYEDYFRIGAATGAGALLDAEKSEFVKNNYNSLTFENAIKQPVISPAEGVWNFHAADIIADFARENNIKLRGHTLLWGNESPDNWMLYDEDGNLVTKEVFYERLRNHMEVIITRYDDVVDDWDVVNEVCYWTNARVIHDDVLYKLCGEEYLDKAFEFAREFAGENDKLFLNETKVVNNDAKQKNLYTIVERLLNRGVAIDGIGIQGHMDTLSFKETPKRLDKVLKKLTEFGLEIQMTEISMTVYNYPAQKAYDSLPQWIETFQIKKFKEMFEVLRSHSDVVTSVTFWGIDDAHSHLVSGTGREDWGFLFDKNSKPKQAFYAVCDF